MRKSITPRVVKRQMRKWMGMTEYWDSQGLIEKVVGVRLVALQNIAFAHRDNSGWTGVFRMLGFQGRSNWWQQQSKYW